jgi:hypothetical protein
MKTFQAFKFAESCGTPHFFRQSEKIPVVGTIVFMDCLDYQTLPFGGVYSFLKGLKL